MPALAHIKPALRATVIFLPAPLCHKVHQRPQGLHAINQCLFLVLDNRTCPMNELLGIMLAIVGGVIFYRGEVLAGIPLVHAIVALVLILNGLFLSFGVSPFLIEREKQGRAGELLPVLWQRKIMVSLIISDIGWWGSLVLLVLYLLK